MNYRITSVTTISFTLIVFVVLLRCHELLHQSVLTIVKVSLLVEPKCQHSRLRPVEQERL